MCGARRIYAKADADQVRYGHHQEFQSLRRRVLLRICEASAVAAGTRQATNETLTYRIEGASHDNWNVLCRLLYRWHRVARAHHDNINIQPDELCRERRKKFRSSFREAPFDHEISAFQIAKLTHALHEAAVNAQTQRSRPRCSRKDPAAPDLRWLLLRACRHRPRRYPTEQRDAPTIPTARVSAGRLQAIFSILDRPPGGLS